MSNPFATFRKNQKVWMAGLVLLAILAFVVAPAIDTATRAFTGGGSGNSVVARWDGGKLTLASLQTYTQKHSILVRFLSALAQEVVDAGGRPDVPGFFYDEQRGQILGLGIQGISDERVIARSQILAEYAERQGIAFSDKAIDEFIVAYCDGRITNQRLNEILEDAAGGRLTWFEIRELLKQELSVLVAQQLARSGLYTNPPGETYQDFRKLNKTAKVQAFPFYVDEYLDEVAGSPSEAELEALYQAGATRAADPNSPEPGFRRRYQANIEYVVANTQDWIDREKEKLTDEQLRQEYDRRVELGQLKVPVEPEPETETESESESAESGDSIPAPADLDLGEAEMDLEDPESANYEGSDDLSATTAEETADNSGNADTTEEDSAEEAGDEPQESPDNAPANAESSSGESSSGESSNGEPSGEQQSEGAENTGDSEAGSASADQPDTNQSSRSRSLHGGVTPHLVAFRPQSEGDTNPTPDDADPQNAASETEGEELEKPAEETGLENEQSDDEQLDDLQPGDEPDSSESGEAESTQSAESAESDPEEGTEAAGSNDAAQIDPGDQSEEAGEADESAGPAMRTQSFEEARETIAESLARDAALAAQQEALTRLQEEVMEPYYAEYRQYQAFVDSGLTEDEEGNPRQPPKRPDLKQLAEEAGFGFRETGMVDGATLAQLPFGLGNVMPDESGVSGSIANVVMNPEFELFKPMEGMYFDQSALQAGNSPEFLRYLFWKVEDREAFIPQLEEIREEVVDAWKRQQAMQLAASAAEALVNKINANAENPWETALSEAERSLVMETNPFTWMTAFGGEPRLSNVPALRDVLGGEFMQQVFSTEPEQFVVAPNAGRTIFYVCRVLEFSPSESELHERFQADPLKSGPLAIARQESDMILSGWFNNIERQLGVEWQMNIGQFFN